MIHVTSAINSILMSTVCNLPATPYITLTSPHDCCGLIKSKCSAVHSQNNLLQHTYYCPFGSFIQPLSIYLYTFIMVSNTGLVFKKVPTASPIIGEHFEIEKRYFDLDAEVPEGCITVKNIYLSFDPYQRGCMREPDAGTWAPAFVPGHPLICGAVAKVLKSTVPSFQAGDLVWGMFGAEEYFVVPPFLLPMARKLDNPMGLDPILYTGALGTSGLSAYTSLYEFGKPQKGQTIFISAASGGVGQIVG
jgi:NADPH-dependent curcumin reductase CurA